jgi:hypothetical protein
MLLDRVRGKQIALIDHANAREQSRAKQNREVQMKKATLVILATLSLAATSQLAQSQLLMPLMKVDVPFDFVAGGQTLPAGQYIVHSDQAHAVWIQSADFKTALSLVSHSAESTEMGGVSALRFNRYGTRYFLSQVWMGSQLGQELRKTRGEREQIAALGASHDVVAVTARR